MILHVQNWGIGGIVYVLVFGDFPGILLKDIVAYLYVHKRILPFRFLFWQTFVVPPLATMILFGVFMFFRQLVFIPLFEVSFYLTLVLAVILLIILALGFYFPLTVWLGGWDDNSFRDFQKAKVMAGPSMFIVNPMFHLVAASVKKAKLHNRFIYDTSDAFREMQELILLRNENRKKQIQFKD